jgi:hypothetical protein
MQLDSLRIAHRVAQHRHRSLSYFYHCNNLRANWTWGDIAARGIHDMINRPGKNATSRPSAHAECCLLSYKHVSQHAQILEWVAVTRQGRIQRNCRRDDCLLAWLRSSCGIPEGPAAKTTSHLQGRACVMSITPTGLSLKVKVVVHTVEYFTQQ